jgi:DNA-binding beta-propeller fold protein YncE
MHSKNAWYALWVRTLIGALCLSWMLCLVPSLRAQQSAPSSVSTVATAIQKDHVLDRLAQESQSAEHYGVSPTFVVDPTWPKPLPHHWLIGDVGGLFVDSHDHIWIIHRPRTLTNPDTGMMGAVAKNQKGVPISAMGFPRPFGPDSNCCMPAPSVLEFDMAGNLIRAWGGPSDPGFLKTKCREQDGCYWPAREHGIAVDQNGYVYISGNGQARNFHGQYPWAPTFGNDSQILKFTSEGKFVYQIGYAGAKGPNSNDTDGGINGTPQPFMVANMVVDPKTNLLYVADGYGNRRILIVNAATGKYVGRFGAYGQNPIIGENGPGTGTWAADYKAGRMKPPFFRSPVHCVALSNDGYLYVCDRSNDRVQIFKVTPDLGTKPCSNPDGEPGKCGFVGEFHVAIHTVGGTATDAAFSSDPKQSCLYVADLNNDLIYIVNRQNLTELTRIGGAGREAGEFHWPHVMDTDSEGNIYVGDVDGDHRVQKFLRTGPAGCSGTGSKDIGAYLQ